MSSENEKSLARQTLRSEVGGGYAKKEEEILEFWKRNKIFEKTLAKTKNKKLYVFYDGPPFATGLPHYGHILASTVKDLIPRYFTMRGRYVPRRWGWDCHGLPIEHLIEGKLAVNSRKEILEIGLAHFNQKAKESVLEYANEWERFVNRIGRFVDFKNSYKTMDADYMESVWWVFSELYKKGLVYKDSRVSLFCPRCSTPLSNFEIAMADAYKNREDPSIYLKFKILPSPKLRQAGKNQNEYFLVWTTTPWTLPANVALALNPGAYYLTIEKDQEWLIISEERVGLLGEAPKIILRQKGEKLLGLVYEPLYKTIEQNTGKTYQTVGADFIDAKEGTGIVHIAPAFGEDDFNLGKKENLATILTLDEAGKFKADFQELEFIEGKSFIEANDLIIKELESRDLIFKKEKIVHSYPFCWRCETPLIYLLQPAWFLNIKKIKKKLLELNEKIDWHPKHLKKGRFGKGIETAPDWNVSRSRFWGAPLPVWQCRGCQEYIVVGSLADLDKYSSDKSKKHNWPYNNEGEVDLHRPFIDEIKLKCRCGEVAERIPDVFDCWFESGSMPYAQAHWPFACAKSQISRQRRGSPKAANLKSQKCLSFPADFVAEGLDQTRGWFYTLHVLAGALFAKPAFRHVITSGIILSAKGEKLSKSKKNFPDPWLIFDKYGVDSLRYYLMISPAMQSENINFSEKDVKEIHQKLVLTLLNVLNYYKLYKKPCLAGRQAKAGRPALNRMNVLDKWILSRLNNLIQKTTKEMDGYEVAKAQRPVLDFVQDLSLWHLRLSRERIKKGGREAEEALAVLEFVLLEFSKLIAPVTPFLAEIVYQDVGGKEPSVHLEDWPRIQKKFINKKIENDMDLIRKTVSSTLRKRAEAGIRVRQPLASLKIKSQISNLKSKKEFLELIKQEVNVKEVVFDSKIKNEVELDTKITPELKKEGMLRELIRQLQETRKELGLTPSQKISIFVETNEQGKKFIKTNLILLRKSVNAQSIEFLKPPAQAKTFEIKLDENIILRICEIRS